MAATSSLSDLHEEKLANEINASNKEIERN